MDPSNYSTDFSDFAEIDQGMVVSAKETVGWVNGKIFGQPPFEGLTGKDGIYRAPTTIRYAHSVLFAPKLGVIVDKNGIILREPSEEYIFIDPTFSKVDLNNQSKIEYDEAACFMPWGSNTNYGHFLIDAMSGILALKQAKIQAPFICPLIAPWQRKIIDFFEFSITEIPEDYIRIKTIYWPSCMNHYLHQPNECLLGLNTIAKTKKLSSEHKLVYVSRSQLIDGKRNMKNEKELEAALLNLGFYIFHPQNVSFEKQVAVFYGADCVVSATGAQMANIVFMRPNTQVFEICPSNYSGIWIRNIAHLLSLRWAVSYFEKKEALNENAYFFDYQIDINRALIEIKSLI